MRETHSDPALDLRQVTKRYGDFTAVDQLSFSVPKGAIYGFLGPNGAGKTTTLRMILEIIKPTSGSIRVLGNSSALKVRSRIGYLPEEKGLYKKMKAWSIIAYFATLKGMNHGAAKHRALELLEQYGLKEFAYAKTEALSKGMGQKVQMLASVAHDPDFVILDEPFSGLDPVNQQVLEEMIRDMAGRGRTVLFSTHVMQHAERLCNRILLMSQGRKIFDGTIDEAKQTIPRRVIIGTEDEIQPLHRLESVVGIRAVNQDTLSEPAPRVAATSTARFWEIRIRENADPQTILQACFQHGIRLSSFNHAEPTLHEVFVQLVGPSAREVVLR